jgi:hypothetical protein
MATREQIRKMVRAEPFRPFLVNMAGGRSFLIEHPENAACDHGGIELVVFDRHGAHYADLRLVDVIEPVQSPIDPAAGGDGPS